MELGWPLPKRKDHIRRLADAQVKETYRVPFQGRQQPLPIRLVPIGFPKYRLDNGRTQAAQAEYLAKHPERPADFFRRDLESEEAHRAQHEILKEMITGGGEKDLLRYFKGREQTQPFILTDDGFVVNGNRRLTAFRELIAEDATTSLLNDSCDGGRSSTSKGIENHAVGGTQSAYQTLRQGDRKLTGVFRLLDMTGFDIREIPDI